MNIREYLVREARRISDNALGDFSDAEAWKRLLSEKRSQFLEMMGLDDRMSNRPPVRSTVTGVVRRSGYRIEKLYYESLPQLYVTSNLYIPGSDVGEAGSLPAVLYLCGHSDTQKVHYQAHARRFAQLGFACLIVETVQLGEVRGYHHGCYREGWFHWYSRGYTPAGVELWNGIRGLDLLCQHPEVDSSRLGVTGISGGGATTWWVAAADERIRVAAPVCGTATLASQIRDRTIDGHCDCMWWINTYRWDLADVGALVAPRPLMIASADRDGIFTIASIREVHQQIQNLYAMLGAEENLRLVETPGEHSYHPRSRTAIFSWFLQHLNGKQVPPEEIVDIETDPQHLESEKTLRVFSLGPLQEDRTLTIHNEWISRPPPPEINTRADLERTRLQVVRDLREKTFGAFPETPPPLDLEVAFEFDWGNATGCRFAFTGEEGWRLHGHLSVEKSLETPAPAVMTLRGPGENHRAADSFLGELRVPWARVVVEPRGTGETAWGEELQWHLRRAAAWTGRTLAGLQVYDTLRAMEAVRMLPQVQDRALSLAARGEMAVVALYASLLDGRISTLFLHGLPASQDAGSRPDGRAAAIEMLNCLRITDLPSVAGLLYPTEIVLVGDCPAPYDWAEALYHRLGEPERFQRIRSLSDWRNSPANGSHTTGDA